MSVYSPEPLGYCLRGNHWVVLGLFESNWRNKGGRNRSCQACLARYHQPHHEKPMPEYLRDKPESAEWCAQCKQAREFGTDGVGRLIETCGCGTRYTLLRKPPSKPMLRHHASQEREAAPSDVRRSGGS